MPTRPNSESVSRVSGVFPASSKIGKPTPTALIVGFGLIGICVLGVLSSPNAAIAGLWCVAMMLVLMFLSVPVALALSFPSIFGIYAVSGIPASVNVLSSAPLNTASSWTYSVLPAFIFMSMLLAQTGMTTKIYAAADRWFSWMPGGIGIGTTAAGAGLASVSGSTIAMTYALAKSAIPEMLRAGFDKRMAVGTVIVAGIPGSLIPPSILLVVYAGIATVPVGPQLLAGAVPGILIAVTFTVYILAIGILFPKLVGRGEHGGGGRPKASWADRFQSLGGIWGLPVILIVLFGGLFSGAFTPTEAGFAAALTTLILGLVVTWRDRPWTKLTQAAFSTVSATAAIFFIIIGAEMLASMLSLTGLASILTGFIVDLGLGQVGFLLVMLVVYIIMGMFFDTLSMMVLTAPILLPTLESMDISVIWFGVFIVLMGEIAMVTPPVGIISFIVHNIAKDPSVNLGHDITLGDVFRSLIWFLPIAFLFVVLLIVWPEIVTWLPELADS